MKAVFCAKAVLPLAAAFLSGCWTVRETVPEEVTFARMPEGREVRVQIAGFDATVTTYETAYAYTTAMNYGVPLYGPRGWGCWGPMATTYSTTEYIPHREPTAVYRDRATDLLERGGCILKSTQPQYRVKVHFDGPFTESGDGWATFGWMAFTIFTGEFGAQDWSARLRIHDVASGKLVFSRDYVRRDEAVVWGPIPIFSPAFSDRTSSGVMKHNCLSMLTDRVIADALAFFVKQ